MQPETKNCQNCKNEFVIEPDDFLFYEKIKVPPPTFCPECRLQRRLSFFNLFHLYKRKCDLCGEEKISSFPPDAPYKAYCPQCWWSDKWDCFEYGQEYDFSKPFFKQFDQLLHKAPLLGISVDFEAARSSPYTHHAGHLKNCYLIFFADFNEDCAYGFYHVNNKLLFDCSLAMLSELSYDCQNLFKSSRCVGTRGNVKESLNCIFLRDSDNCQDCFASANLRNKKYYIFNKPYNKEEYAKEIKKYDLGSYRNYKETEKLAREHWKNFPPRPRYDDFSVNSTGSYVFRSKNCKDCYEVEGAEDSKFLMMLYQPPIKDCYDVVSWGNNISLMCECCSTGENSSNMRFCNEAGLTTINAEYCKALVNSSNCFGCVGMKKGNYCILNKKYSKEEYQELRAKIINHMNEMPYNDKNGRIYRYGEFFPAEISPHSYNETLAMNFFPMSKEITLEEGFRWQKDDIREYVITIPSENLPNHIKDAKDNILDEIIGCSTCLRGFKIIKIEFDFLKKMNLPLPRQCPFCRIDSKFNQWIKQMRSILRKCDKCGLEFQTNYSKEEASYILCKQCWFAEVV